MAVQAKLKNRVSNKTDGQKDYIRSIIENVVTICNGPSGTGKTMVSIGLGCEHLAYKKIDRLIITKPCVESGRGLGFIPGELSDKYKPYFKPIFDYLSFFLFEKSVKELISSGQIYVSPLEYMRGETFDDSLIIVDDAENYTFHQLKMIITRLGNNSRIVINGDVNQTDLVGHFKSGFESFSNKLQGLEEVGIIHLTNADILRNHLLGRILNALEC